MKKVLEDIGFSIQNKLSKKSILCDLRVSKISYLDSDLSSYLYHHIGFIIQKNTEDLGVTFGGPMYDRLFNKMF